MKIRPMLISLMAGVLLSSCVDQTLTLSEGGMSGTGITTAGRITGFGSIYVNGIHYNVDNAQFYRNGVLETSGQSAFSLGEYVSVDGVADTASGEGQASRVDFSSQVYGDVTSVAADGQSVVILGQTVRVDALTVFHGVSSLADLQAGSLVEVSGSRDANHVLVASSVYKHAAPSSHEGAVLRLQGVVSQLSVAQSSFRMGALAVDYAAAELDRSITTLADGLFVEVKATQAPVAGRLTATWIGIKPVKTIKPDAHVGVEGIVTTIRSADRFTLDRQEVETHTQTRFMGLERAAIALGMTLNVEGLTDAAGVLQADKIVVRKSDSDDDGLELKGQITAIDADQQTLVVSGYTLLIDRASMLLDGKDDSPDRHGASSFGQLQVGDYIEARVVRLEDGTYQVVRLDRGGRRR